LVTIIPHKGAQVKSLDSQFVANICDLRMTIRAAVVFFASDEAGYITGATLDINGGMYMR